MIIPNKRELQQIAFNHPSDTELKDCANLKKMYCKIISFLIIDVTRASDNPLHFRKLSGRTQKLIMITDNKIRDENFQYDINREAATYQHYYLEKLINMNILQVNKRCLLIKIKQ